MNLALCGIAELASDRIVIADDTFLRWLGKSQSEVVGRRMNDLVPPRVADFLEELKSGPRAERILLEPGGAFPSAVRFELVEDGTDDYLLAGYDVSIMQSEIDILEHAQRMSVRESERLQLLLEASVAFADALTLEELGPLVAEAARKSFRASAASVHILEDGGYRMLAGENPLLEFWPNDAPRPGARTVEIGNVLQITSPEQAEKILTGIGESYRLAGVHATLVAPIVEQGTPIGALACYFDHERHFDEQAEPLARALAQQAAQAFVRIKLGGELRHRVMHDEITGLPNRRLFEEQINAALRGRQKSVAVFFIDLDRFKPVNDELGHAFGDALLAQVGERLQSVFREEDLVARYGGDEFIAVCGATDHRTAVRIGERIREAIAQPFTGLPTTFEITASVGAVLSPASDEMFIEGLIRLADRAMYTAKAAGGNRVHFVQD
ncbi:MAG: diguanylate cyclase [Actinomycetota bacterium]|nr:diguanylate cyclase [Actinomycetota bacterium]